MTAAVEAHPLEALRAGCLELQKARDGTEGPKDGGVWLVASELLSVVVLFFFLFFFLLFFFFFFFFFFLYVLFLYRYYQIYSKGKVYKLL